MRFSLCASGGLAVIALAVSTLAQDALSRRNELTIAGLRPGQDTLETATKKYKSRYLWNEVPEGMRQWRDTCTGRALTIGFDEQLVVQEVTVSALVPSDGKCDDRPFETLRVSDWITGLGLRLGDPQHRVIELYGDPASIAPSIKEGRELELFHYAFDFASPDEPQVLQVSCERDTGRVVEITLAYPTL